MIDFQAPASVSAPHVLICNSRRELGEIAAQKAAALTRSAIGVKGRARILIATGNSQLDFIAALVKLDDLNWNAIEVFHMDEYVGINPEHSASFQYWIKSRVEQLVHPGIMNYLSGDAPDLDAEIRRYSKLLTESRIDVAFVGFGENGHIAFNDPHVADFDEAAVVKRVALDEACRRQQAGEGHFEDLDSVPKEALTVTCSGLFGAAAWICCVPERRKAEAVRNALEGPISPAWPASLVRRHRNAYVYLDGESASLLSATTRSKMEDCSLCI